MVTTARLVLIAATALYWRQPASVGTVPVPDGLGGGGGGGGGGRQTRHHRNHRHALPLRNAQNYSICPFRVEEDRVDSRIPAVLEHVYCEQDGHGCTDDSAFSCMQLYTNVQVVYPSTGTNQTVKLYHGCVCGRSKGMPAHLLEHYNVAS